MTFKEILGRNLPLYVNDGYFSSEEEIHDELMKLIEELGEEYGIDSSSYNARELADDYEEAMLSLLNK